MIQELVTNQIFVSVLITGFISEIWKFMDTSIRAKKIKWKVIFATGGMPSSHSSFVLSIATSVGLVEGFTSSIFLVALGFAMIVFRDAFGVRRAVDNLSNTINGIIQEKKLGITQIFKIAGHTPVQAIVGAVVGIIIPCLIHIFYM